MNKLVNESVIDIIGKVIKECSKHYGFDSEEAMIRLGLKEESDRKEESDSVSVEKKVVLKKEKKIPLPYNGEEDKNNCCGLNQNHGLYTQCEKKKKENDLCETCNKQALKNESGKPDYGRIEDRKQVGWMEFRDPKGKKPISYLKLMNKLGLTKEEVRKEAEKRNKQIDEMHFEEEEEEEEKKKGRPKKSKKVLEVEGETNDLFAELIASVNTKVVMEPLEPLEPLKEEKKLPATPRLEEASISEAPKSPISKAKKDKKEKVVKEKIVKEKVVKEKVVKEKVVKEKVVKEKKEKVISEAKKEKKVVSDNKKEESQQEESQQEESQQEESQQEESQQEESQQEVIKKEEEEEADVVKRFEYEGIKYLKSKKTGIIYNMDQELVGKWNDETNKIDFEEHDEEEEEEEEYDE